MNHLHPGSREIFGLFNDSFPPVIDGVTLTVENYCRWLVESGRKVTVVTPWNPVSTPHPDFDIFRYVSLPIYNRHPYRYGFPKADPMIWRRLRHTPFRIVHAHCPFSSGRLAAYAAAHHQVPLVATFHSKYRTDLRHSLPEWMVERQMRKILRFYSSATEVWIPQRAVEETLREYGYRGQVRVVENGNDFAEGIDNIEAYKSDSRRRLGIAPATLSLLFVGQHILEKGIEVIVRALALLPDSLDYQMTFIGEGYARDCMIELTHELGLSDKVSFLGLIEERETLRRHYAAADLLLFPSYYDNAPLVVREAAAVMTPAILPEGATAAELITHGSNGFLASRTPEAYSQAIASLSRHDIISVGRKARKTLCRSWRDVMDEVIGLYDEIISRYDTDHR